MSRYATLTVGKKTAVIGGFLTEDESIYAPSTKPKFTPVTEACSKTWEEAKKDLGKTPDLFLPMTHQVCASSFLTTFPSLLFAAPSLLSSSPCLLVAIAISLSP